MADLKQQNTCLTVCFSLGKSAFQTMEWKNLSSPYLKKVRQLSSNIKSMVVIFLTVIALFMRNFTPPGHMVNRKVWQDQKVKVCQKLLERWRNCCLLIHHDYVLAHTLFGQCYSWPLKPLWLSIIFTCWFWHCVHSSSQELNCSYKGIVFRMSLKFSNTHWQSYIWFQKGHFQCCFQHWQKRWICLINLKGSTFKNDQ